MGFFDHDDESQRDAYNQVHHEGKTSHELIGGAAAFMAMRAYEQKQESEGKPESFEFAKEMIAGIAGFEADKLIETKGLDAWDARKAKHEAEEQAKQALAQSNQFGNQQHQYQSFEQGRYGNDYQGPPQGYGGAPYGYGGPQLREFSGGQGGYGGPQGGYGGPQGGYGQPQSYGSGYGGPPNAGFGNGYGGQQGNFEASGGGYQGEGRHHHEGRRERREEEREEREFGRGQGGY